MRRKIGPELGGGWRGPDVASAPSRSSARGTETTIKAGALTESALAEGSAGCPEYANVATARASAQQAPSGRPLCLVVFVQPWSTRREASSFEEAAGESSSHPTSACT
jgi:hypothetical protein